MFRSSTRQLSHYNSYRFNARLTYWSKPPNRQIIFGEDHDFLAQPKIEEKFKKGLYVDQKVDLRDKEHLDLSEGMRNPKERDHYLDHTYHEEWIRRDLNYNQSKQILKMYKHLTPGNAISPWIWFPGDIVEVVSGPFAGQRGAIVTVLKYKNEIMVQNVNVQPITIPATESRPEQIMQREHPINVQNVKHVDPTTNEICDVRMITVRDKETGKKEKRRVSLSSGVLLQIPKKDSMVYEGDPLHDTPLQDAEEDTYDEPTELPVIIERKLKALEDHFVEQLRVAHEYHREHEAKNAASLTQYQRDVISRAKEIVAQRLLVSAVGGGDIEGGENNTDNSRRRVITKLNNAIVDHILMSSTMDDNNNNNNSTLRRRNSNNSAQMYEDEEFDQEEDEEEEQQVSARA